MSSLLTIPTFFLCGPALPPSSPHALDKLVLRLNWKNFTLTSLQNTFTYNPFGNLKSSFYRSQEIEFPLNRIGKFVQEFLVCPRIISCLVVLEIMPERTDGVAATGCGKLSRWRNRSSFSLLIARHSGLPSLEACDSSWAL